MSQEIYDMTRRLDRSARQRIKYLMGSPMVKEDLVRAQTGAANLVFVLANTFAEDPEREDKENILRALSVKAACRTPFRLMLLRPESTVKAVTMGIKADDCCVVNELTPSIFFQPCRCPGYDTL